MVSIMAGHAVAGGVSCRLFQLTQSGAQDELTDRDAHSARFKRDPLRGISGGI